MFIMFKISVLNPKLKDCVILNLMEDFAFSMLKSCF